jgi:alpha-1,2-mannosyltransferase
MRAFGLNSPVTFVLNGLREAAWLTRERVIAIGVVLLIEQVLLLVFIALWQHGVFRLQSGTTSSDFVSFYAAGKLALAGTPALAYDQAAHHLAQQATTGSNADYQFFFYPPVFLMLCAGLARLPYPVAFALFELVTIVMFIMATRCVLRETGAAWIVPLLAFPPVFWTIGLGQNAFLTAALFAGFTLLMDRRPTLSGILLGLLCYKPHFGLLAPLALVAGQRWRTVIAATTTVVGLVLLSIALFGWNTWSAYLFALAHADGTYTTGRIDYAGIVTPFGAARLMGFPVGLAYVSQAIVAALMALLIALIWRRVRPLPLRAASLLAATLLAVPLVLLYDELLVLVAVGWLVGAARETGFLPWEKIVLASTYGLTLVLWHVGAGLHVPLGPVINLAILILCVRRIWWGPSDRIMAAGQSGGTIAAL